MGVSFGKRVFDMLNKQISEEFGTAYLYLAMSGVLKDMGLTGCADWMMRQFQEEYRQAIKIYKHIQERGTKIKLLPIAAPKQEWRAPIHIFEEMLRHEQKNSVMINAIYEYALAEKDYQSLCFITEFVQEQAKKEATIAYLFDRLRKMQSTELGVIMFDAELSQKV
ncbi:MAG: ferritin [Holosporaceae bacterium]|jgi:ferritin|nr:ferritin [Holosporaceae bacterium]